MARNNLSDNIPPPLTSFVGREEALGAIMRLLATTRLLTLTGPGGCGKTRLANEASARLQAAQTFSDGVGWVELSDLSDPNLVPYAVASTLGVRAASGRSLPQALLDYLRSRSLLLVLDNCEHLVAACAELAEGLLGACPNLRILLTSREALGMTGETTWPVPPLSMAEYAQEILPKNLPVNTLIGNEAVRLFVERASAVLPAFTLDEQNVRAVVQVCRRLDGMPLAIELAAARVRVLAVDQIAARLDDALGLLTMGSRTALPRHQTLQATIDWSYRLLAEREQVLLRRLSVFSGSFSLEAVETVCADASGTGRLASSKMLDLLSRLVDKSLVVVHKQHGKARYRLLETIRQYSAALHDPAEAAVFHKRHAAFFLGLAEQMSPHLIRPDRIDGLDALEREHANLRAVLQWTSASGETEAGLRLSGALWWFWFHRGYWSEGRQWIARLLDAGERANPPIRRAVRARALLTAGMLAWTQGDHSTARIQLEESAALSRKTGDTSDLGYALSFLGQALLGSSDTAEARIAVEESIDLFREIGDSFGLGQATTTLGMVHQVSGDLEAARHALTESAALFRRAGDRWGLALPLRNLGYGAFRQHDYARAAALQQESLALLRGLDEKWFVSRSLELLAETIAMQGDYTRAACLFGASEALREAVGAAVLPYYQDDYERGVAAVRAGLNEADLRAAWAKGRTLTVEQVIAYATERTSTEPGAVKNPPRLRLLALGTLDVFRNEQALSTTDWRFAKPKELLFYLLSHAPRSKDQIGLVLWPEAAPDQLRNSFHVTLYHLRRALGGAEWIHFENGRYQFNRSLDYWFDVEVFEAKVSAALESRTSSPAKAVRLLEEAAALYRGDFLEDFACGDWALPRREALRHKYLDALLTLGELLLVEERASEAVEVYRQASLHDPYCEAAHRGVMRGYARLGRRGQGLRHYQHLIALLRDELGVSPEAETVEFFERLKSGAAVDSGVAKTGGR